MDPFLFLPLHRWDGSLDVDAPTKSKHRGPPQLLHTPSTGPSSGVRAVPASLGSTRHMVSLLHSCSPYSSASYQDSTRHRFLLLAGHLLGADHCHNWFLSSNEYSEESSAVCSLSHIQGSPGRQIVGELGAHNRGAGRRPGNQIHTGLPHTQGSQDSTGLTGQGQTHT